MFVSSDSMSSSLPCESLSKNSKQVFWTPTDRHDLVFEACMSSGIGSKGRKGPYAYKVLPRQTQPQEQTSEKDFVTSALAKSIHDTPTLRKIALQLYENLQYKVSNHPATCGYAARHIRVIVKGGTAYSLLAANAFPPSDLDIVILIDPILSSAVFNVLKSSVTTVALQTVSQFKRTLDHMFFPTSSTFHCNDKFLTTPDIELFKNKLTHALGERIEQQSTDMYVSPLVGKFERNTASRNSFLLTDSIMEKQAVVLVEVPHYERCQNIPLRKTPFFVSHNRSLCFHRRVSEGTRDIECKNDEMMAKFDLIRLKMNILRCDANTGRPNHGRNSTIPAGMVDISIPDQTDHELTSFWTTERAFPGSQTVVLPVCVRKDENENKDVKDAKGISTNEYITVTIPTIDVLIDDLDKMLNVYDCPAFKQERRLNCLRTLQALKEEKNVKNL